MIIGICGKSCSGKSTLSTELDKYFDRKCITVEIDKIGHYVLTLDEVRDDLVKYFGSSILRNGNINRKYLSKIVFSSDEKMGILANITWPYMEREIDKILDNNKDGIVILDYLLLPITKYLDICDFKILFDIPYEIRKERAIRRDGISEEEFLLRDQASIEFDYNYFDYVIRNNDKETYRRMVKLL